MPHPISDKSQTIANPAPSRSLKSPVQKAAHCLTQASLIYQIIYRDEIYSLYGLVNFLPALT